MPSIWGGLALTLFSAGTLIALFASGTASEEGLSTSVSLLIQALVFLPWVYWLYCVYKFHDAIDAVSGYNHPISGARAVAFHFIPFFNLYWVFKWPSTIARFVNWRMQQKAMHGWIAGLAMLLALILFQLLSVFGLVAVYLAGFYIERHLRRAFDAPPVPESAKESMMPGMLRLS